MSETARMIPIPKGSLLTITTGIYSDYCVRGVFRAKSEIDADALRNEYLALYPDQGETYSFEESKFLAWAAGKGFLETLDTFEWHISDYSNVAEMTVEHNPAGSGD